MAAKKLTPEEASVARKQSRQRDKIRQLYGNWEQYASDAQYYENMAEQYAKELQELGIDPENPPEWLAT